MEQFDHDDHETPIEEYPGHIGHLLEGEFYPGPALVSLRDFDWDRYYELVEAVNGIRCIAVSLPAGALMIEVDAHTDVARILNQIPSVEVYQDSGSHGGPGSGGAYIFLIADGFTLDEVAGQIAALRAALDSDLALLSRSGA